MGSYRGVVTDQGDLVIFIDGVGVSLSEFLREQGLAQPRRTKKPERQAVRAPRSQLTTVTLNPGR